MKATEVIASLQRLRSSSRAYDAERFFKTTPGQYGEGDQFLGVPVPQTRSVARKFRELNMTEIAKLLASPWHEARLCGLVILTERYRNAKERSEKKTIFDFYMKAMKAGQINNWDLIDVTAPTIGEYLIETEDPYPLLIKLARSRSLWQRRLSVLFTFAFIRAADVEPTLYISEVLLADDHDLIHKAVGWMLREAGKRDIIALRNFLKQHAHVMPRTMLRYSIEKLPERERKKWLIESRAN